MKHKTFNLRLGQIFSCVVLAATCVAADAVESSARIAVVDVANIMKTIPQREAVANKLRSEFKGRNDTMVSAHKTIEKMEERMKKASGTSEAEAKKLDRELRAQKISFMKMQEEFREDLMRRENEETQKLMTQIANAVDLVAKEQKYDMVLRREAAPFFVSNQFDITTQVLERLKKGTAK